MRANIGRFCTYIKDCFVETDDIRSAASAPPLMAEPMTEGGHFRHPGGGGRLSVTDGDAANDDGFPNMASVSEPLREL